MKQKFGDIKRVELPPWKGFWKLTFRALALRHSLWRIASARNVSFLNIQFTVEILSTRLIKPNFCNKASLRIERLILVTSCILREQSCPHQNDSWVIKKSWMSIQQDATKFQLVAPSFNICFSTNVELCIIGLRERAKYTCMRNSLKTRACLLNFRSCICISHLSRKFDCSSLDFFAEYA